MNNKGLNQNKNYKNGEQQPNTGCNTAETFFQLQESAVQAEGTIFETGAYRELFVEPFIQHDSQP